MVGSLENLLREEKTERKQQREKHTGQAVAGREPAKKGGEPLGNGLSPFQLLLAYSSIIISPGSHSPERVISS